MSIYHIRASFIFLIKFTLKVCDGVTTARIENNPNRHDHDKKPYTILRLRQII